MDLLPSIHVICYIALVDDKGRNCDVGLIVLACKNLVYSGSKANVKMTMVNGKILYENGVFAEELQAGKIYQTCEEITRKLCDH